MERPKTQCIHMYYFYNEYCMLKLQKTQTYSTEACTLCQCKFTMCRHKQCSIRYQTIFSHVCTCTSDTHRRTAVCNYFLSLFFTPTCVDLKPLSRMRNRKLTWKESFVARRRHVRTITELTSQNVNKKARRFDNYTVVFFSGMYINRKWLAYVD